MIPEDGTEEEMKAAALDATLPQLGECYWIGGTLMTILAVRTFSAGVFFEVSPGHHGYYEATWWKLWAEGHIRRTR